MSKGALGEEGIRWRLYGRCGQRLMAKRRIEVHMGRTVVVTGGGGFIGGHLVKRLRDEGNSVRAVDLKPLHEWWQVFEGVENHETTDVGREHNAYAVVDGADEVYNLAADMGGMGFIANNKLQCMLSVLPSTWMVLASSRSQVPRFFYSSSACIYPDYRQEDVDILPLKEADAYPAEPEDGYGWEKLFTERMCRHAAEDAGLETRVGRYHNVYGPHGSWTGGREKAPAAMCRKVANAMLTDQSTIEIWGDGAATRTFMYVDDCVEGTLRVMRGASREPVNIGSDEVVSVDELARMIEAIAGVNLRHVYVPGPQGVRGRSSDNTLLRQRYDWEPSVKLADGLERTFRWVYDQVKRSLDNPRSPHA